MSNNPNQIDPTHPDYNEDVRDSVISLLPSYCPYHKCGVVKDYSFRDVIKELKARASKLKEENERLKGLLKTKAIIDSGKEAIMPNGVIVERGTIGSMPYE